MKDFERRATLASIAVVVLVVAFGSEAITAETIGDATVETRAYSGTREIRHTVDAGSTASSEEDYYGVFDVEASRTDKRSGEQRLRNRDAILHRPIGRLPDLRGDARSYRARRARSERK